MLRELLLELVSVAIALALAMAIGFIWRLLRRHPVVMVALGAALLGLAVYLVLALMGANLRTEGSPAGTIIAVVLLSAAAGAGLLGLVIAGTGLVDAGKRDNLLAACAAGLLVFGVVAGSGLGLDRGRSHGEGTRHVRDRYADSGLTREPRGVAAAPERKYPPLAERAGARNVAVADAYALSWKERGAAKALAMRIPAAQFEAEDPGVVETADGPRHLDLVLVEPFAVARLRLHRDDSELDDGVHESLFGLAPRESRPERTLWVDDSRGGWRWLGFDCDPRAPARGDLAREGGPGCHRPSGWFARHVPSLFGPSSTRLHARSAAGTCTLTFLYRGRPVALATPGACFTERNLASLAAAPFTLERLRSDATSPPLAAERLDRARAAATRCEKEARDAGAAPVRRVRREFDASALRGLACRHAARLATAERDASPEAASELLQRLEEGAPR